MSIRLVWTRALLETTPRLGWACVLVITSLRNSHSLSMSALGLGGKAPGTDVRRWALFFSVRNDLLFHRGQGSVLFPCSPVG
ncbi:hypothetical protein JB92DRAFT_3002022 [Gautieria morchelliformis]|nr:hypothetical protein JB92DRAFT_3073256 [Gautieria morchelliformis]KAF8492687.1 hypothetical protein JB92DRAFT_3002022 [Gautieria morchelliformis]